MQEAQNRLMEYGLAGIVIIGLCVLLIYLWREYKYEKKEKMKAYELVIQILKEKDR